jgi:hypothetical protein
LRHGARISIISLRVSFRFLFWLRNARVAKWQTRKIQNLVPARAWRFKSSLAQYFFKPPRRRELQDFSLKFPGALGVWAVFVFYETTFCGLPSKNARRFSTLVCKILRRHSIEAQLKCGVRMQFGAFKSGLVSSGGSWLSTSAA